MTVPLASLTWFIGLGQFLWPARLSPEYPDLPASAGLLALGWAALAVLAAAVVGGACGCAGAWAGWAWA